MMHPDDEWSYLERLSTCESATASPTTRREELLKPPQIDPAALPGRSGAPRRPSQAAGKTLEEPGQVGNPPPDPIQPMCAYRAGK